MKVEFLNELIVKPYRKTPVSVWDGRNWKMESDFILRITDGRKICHLITVPKDAGMNNGWSGVTDFASVPTFFHRVLNPQSALEASVPHDFFYRTGLVTKAQADKIFLLGMVALKVPKWKRQTMYYAVKMFGGSSYNKFTQEKLNIKL